MGQSYKETEELGENRKFKKTKRRAKLKPVTRKPKNPNHYLEDMDDLGEW